jgi:hypothetical protein
MLGFYYHGFKGDTIIIANKRRVPAGCAGFVEDHNGIHLKEKEKLFNLLPTSRTNKYVLSDGYTKHCDNGLVVSYFYLLATDMSVPKEKLPTFSIVDEKHYGTVRKGDVKTKVGVVDTLFKELYGEYPHSTLYIEDTKNTTSPIERYENVVVGIFWSMMALTATYLILSS